MRGCFLYIQYKEERIVCRMQIVAGVERTETGTTYIGGSAVLHDL